MGNFNSNLSNRFNLLLPFIHRKFLCSFSDNIHYNNPLHLLAFQILTIWNKTILHETIVNIDTPIGVEEYYQIQDKKLHELKQEFRLQTLQTSGCEDTSMPYPWISSCSRKAPHEAKREASTGCCASF